MMAARVVRPGALTAIVSLAWLTACSGGDSGGGTMGSAAGQAGVLPGAGTSAGGQANGNAGATAGAGTSVSAGTGGTSVGAGGAAPMGGTAGTVAMGGSGGTMMRPEATCSEAEMRTDPPAGKENFKAAPIDQTFPFSSHWMGDFDGTQIGMTSLTDLDNDGDLDFASGRVGGDAFWYEYCTADHWVKHHVGTGHASPGGGNATDVDQDGWVDLVLGDSWYKNPQNPQGAGDWDRYQIGTFGGAEDIVVGDISGDGVADVLWIWNNYMPFWASPGADPTAAWPPASSFEHIQTQGGAIGDIDDDGDNDVVVGNQYWYRNLNGTGTQWETVTINDPFPADSPMVNLGDIDGDGDLDIVTCTHFGDSVAWVENVDGDGTDFTLHPLGSGKAQLHSVFAIDFDNDGDLDVYTGENAGKAYIYDNTDGKGTFIEHVVSNVFRGHDARVGDIDCDGDIDIAGKPWDAPGGDHIYLQNMAVEMGAPPVFDRPAGEVWHKVQDRACP